MATEFEIKCEILGDLWMEYRDEPGFTDFVEYNDLGLPLAYAVAGGIATTTAVGKQYINETFDLLLAALSIDEDTGYDSLDDLLATSDFG